MAYGQPQVQQRRAMHSTRHYSVDSKSKLGAAATTMALVCVNKALASHPLLDAYLASSLHWTNGGLQQLTPSHMARGAAVGPRTGAVGSGGGLHG